MEAYADQFLAALERRSHVVAVDALIAARLEGGALWDVVAPALRESGARWARDEWTVGQEHAATAIAESALSTVSWVEEGARRGRLVAACPVGELHAFAVRLMVEALRDRGWDVTFLGASVPAHQLALPSSSTTDPTPCCWG